MTGFRHGHWNTPTWQSWKSMRERCTDPNNASWANYGGRGISYDPRWDKFEHFLADMGERPADCSLEREFSDGNYCKENCRWAPTLEQNSNRRDNIKLTHEGETLTLTEWARRKGINKQTIFTRYYKYGLNTKELFRPVRGSWYKKLVA